MWAIPGWVLYAILWVVAAGVLIALGVILFVAFWEVWDWWKKWVGKY
jgi:hypothetical protein